MITAEEAQDIDTLRAKVLVIFAAAEGETLRIGYASRRIVDEIIAPLTEQLAAAEQERDRYREGLEAIKADKDRNRWHPGTKFPPTGRNWHDGYITALSSHWLLAERYLDPEGMAEHDRQWRIGTTGTDAEWWEATGHCGHCGDVGSSCSCDGTCGCADLHGPRLPDWKSDSQLLKEAQAALAAAEAREERVRALHVADRNGWCDGLLDALDDLEAARAEIDRLAAALAEERAKVAEAERKGAERAWDEGSVAGWRDRTETLKAGWRGRPKPDGTPNPYRPAGEQP